MQDRKCVVVGAGISGLLAGYWLQKNSFEVQLIEASSRVGGWIESEKIGSEVHEWGPHSILADQEWLSLFRELGLSWIEVPQTLKSRYIYQDKKRVALPLNPIELFQSPLLSLGSKLKSIQALFKKVEVDETDLSIKDLFSRLLPEEAVRYLVDPFCAGIFAGDISKLSAAACFPMLWDHLKAGKSLFSFAKKKKKTTTVSFFNGLEELNAGLFSKLKKNIRLQSPCKSVHREASGAFVVECDGLELRTPQVIVTTPSFVTAEICQSFLSQQSYHFLKNLEYQQMALINTQWEKPSNFESGYGVLFPSCENQNIRGSLWPSEMFPQRLQDKNLLLAAQFYSGSAIPENDQEVEVELKKIQEYLGLQSPCLRHKVRRLEKAIPQYGLDHRSHCQKLRKELPKGLQLAGNYLDGVGLSAVFRVAKQILSEAVLV